MIVLRMKQKGYTYSLMNFFNKLFDLIFIIFFAYLIGNRYEIRVLSQSIAILLVTLISIYFGRDIWNFINLNNNNKLKNNLKDIFHYSYPLLFASLISWVFQSFDKIAIRQWSTYNQLGLYTAAFKIVAILNIVKISFTTFWTPTSLEKYHEEKNNNKFFENMYSLVFIFMFLISLTTIAFKDIIILLLGSDYREAVTVMPLLVFMPFMYTISEITVIGINFKKKPKWHILISLVTSIINVTGNYFFVPLIGAKGAAISTGFSWIIFFTMRTYISLIYYKVNFKLVKSYFFIFTLFLYAMYVTFYYNIILNFIIYLIIIISFLIINFKFLKTNTLKLLKELK
jgi:O-antigen/teichoic acid export membrane protein